MGNPLTERLGPWRRDPVAQRLRSIRLRQRLFNLCALLLAGLCALLAYVIGEMCLDRRWEFSSTTREALLAVALCAIGSAVVVIALRVLLRHSNPLFHARAVDRALGVNDDALITYVDLRRARSLSAGDADVAVLLKAEAERRLTLLDTDQVVDARPVLRSLWAFGAGAIVLLLLFAGWGHTFRDSFRRCVMPWLDIAPPRTTQIVQVAPGNSIAVAGEPVTFAAEVSADAPPREAALVYQADGENSDVQEALVRTTQDKVTALRARDRSNGLYVKELPGLIRPVTYWIRCQDATQGPFRLNVVERPLVTAVNVRVLPPSYAAFAPPREVAGGHVQAIVGSRLEIAATVTQTPRQPRPLADTSTAWLQTGAIRMPMSVVGNTLVATVPVQGNFEYRIGYVDTNGLTSRESVQYQVKAIPDQPPTAFLRREDAAEGTPAGTTETVYLRGEAADDLGVAKLSLRAALVGSASGGTPRALDCSPAMPTGSVSRSIALDLRPLKLKEGDVVECVLVAEDVRRPTAQQAASAPVRIPVVQRPDPPAAAADTLKVARKAEEADAQPKESAQPPGAAEKLVAQEEELLREVARLVQEGLDDETKKKLADLADKQEQLADQMTATVEQEAKDGAGEGQGQAESKQGGAQPGQQNAGKEDGGGERNGKKESAGQQNAGKTEAGEKQGADGKGQGEKQPGDAGQGQGKGQGQGQEQGKGEDAKGQGQGQGQNQGHGQDPGQGQNPGGQTPNAQNSSGGGGALKQSGMQAAREELAEAAHKIRDGEADEEVLRKAKDAFDHLFRAGRAFREKDREALASRLSRDAAAQPGKKPAGDGTGLTPGPEGKARSALSGGKGPASNVLKNVPGELKQDELGQPTSKGQGKISPEYRKALESYYKAIAK